MIDLVPYSFFAKNREREREKPEEPEEPLEEGIKRRSADELYSSREEAQTSCIAAIAHEQKDTKEQRKSYDRSTKQLVIGPGFNIHK